MIIKLQKALILLIKYERSLFKFRTFSVIGEIYISFNFTIVSTEMYLF